MPSATGSTKAHLQDCSLLNCHRQKKILGIIQFVQRWNIYDISYGVTESV
jgi:hypothetical protein